MNIQEAGDAPRISVGGPSEPTGQQKTKESISLESGFSESTIAALKKMGHLNILHGTPVLLAGLGDTNVLNMILCRRFIMAHPIQEKMGWLQVIEIYLSCNTSYLIDMRFIYITVIKLRKKC